MKLRVLVLAATFAPALLAPAQELTFRHFAGTDGGRGWNDGPVATARLDTPGGVVADAAGNLYVADGGSHTIRKVTPTGVVTTLAGMAGVAGSADGKGISAFFKQPTGLALDGSGNLWVADTQNHTIRKVSPTGVVTTVAGMAGTSGFTDGTGNAARFSWPSGLWWDTAGARLLVADSSNGRVRTVTPAGAVSTLRRSDGLEARFASPGAVTADTAGNVFVVETYQHVIGKLSTDGVQTTFVGLRYGPGFADGAGSVARFWFPQGMASDLSGNLWVADCGNHVVRKVSAAGTVTTVAGFWALEGSLDGIGTAARFSCPFAIGRDGAGRFVVADSTNSNLRRTTAEGVVTTVAGKAHEGGNVDGSGSAARFGTPEGVIVDAAGTAWVADSGSATIRRVFPGGAVTTIAGRPGYRGHDDGPPGVGTLYAPRGLAMDIEGNLLVTDRSACTVRRVSRDGTITTLAGTAFSCGTVDGTGLSAKFLFPRGIAVDAEGNAWVADDSGSSSIRKVAPDGTVTTLRGLLAGEGEPGAGEEAPAFSSPADVAVGPDGNLYVADTGNDVVRRVTPGGTVTTVAGLLGAEGMRDGAGRDARFNAPGAIAFAPDGSLLVLEPLTARIRRISEEGVVTTAAGPAVLPSWADAAVGIGFARDGTGPGASFDGAIDLAVGPDGSVLVADAGGLALRVGRPALDDAATVDPATGSVGERRILASVPSTATTWEWAPDRIEAGSAAALESNTERETGFTPDVEGRFTFRLAASDSALARVSYAALEAGTVPPTAVMSPSRVKSCAGGPTELRVDLKGTPPWTLTWSDGLTQAGILESPVSRFVSPAATSTWSIVSVSDANGPGSAGGATTVETVPAPYASVSGSRSICAGATASIEARLGGDAPFVVAWSDGFTAVCASWSCTRTVSPSTTTTYSVVSVTDSNCTRPGSGSATITVQELPTATVTGSTTVCSGQSAELRADLTGTGPWKVTWSDGFVDQGLPVSPSRRVVSPGSTTTYTVTSVSDLSCTNAGSGSATVTVLAGAAPSVAIDVSSPVAAGTTGIVASVPDAWPGATYAWTITNGSITAGQGSRSVVFSAGQAGPLVLRVTVSVPGGCTATGSMPVWVGADPASPIYFSRFAGPDGGGGWFDGPAERARFFSPSGIAVDAAGNVLIVEREGVIRMMTPEGRVSTLAGGGGAVSLADGRGVEAGFYFPLGIAVTGAGIAYVVDTRNHTVRRVDPDGLVTTIAGTPGAYGVADGSGTGARFREPSGIAADRDGNLFVADTTNHTIRKVTSAGVVTTVAGLAGAKGAVDGEGSSARFWSPAGIAVDGTGNLYVADTGNSTIRRISTSGAVTTVAGREGVNGGTDGPAADARFRNPAGVAVSVDGSVFIADTGNATIRLISPDGIVSTLAGIPLAFGSEDGTGVAARFSSPIGIAVDLSGGLLVADRGNYAVRHVSLAGVVRTLAGRASRAGTADGAVPEARFNRPYGVTIGPDGSAWIADAQNNCIRRISATGLVETVAGSCGVEGSADGPGATARFYFPSGIAVSASGVAYVSDMGNETIRRIDPSGLVSTIAGLAGFNGSRDGTGGAARFYSPWGIAVDADENVFVADSDNHTIRMIRPSGVVTTLAGLANARGSEDGTGSAARFYTPIGLTIDRFGNLYVGDSTNGRIRKVSREGVVTTLAGGAGISGSDDGPGEVAQVRQPRGLAIDGSGNIWVAENGSRIKKVSPDGFVSTIGGSLTRSGAADGTGRDAQLGAVYGVGIRWSGELVTVDSSYHGLFQGVSSLPDEAQIDSAHGGVGEVRQLDAQPRVATSWSWELVRTESASRALLSATDVPNPTFTPDAPGYYRFRLTATNGDGKSVTMVSLFVDLPPATAVVTGSASICQESVWFTARFSLTGIAPWTLTWSDGEVWTNYASSTGGRWFYADSNMAVSVVSVADETGPGVPSGVAEIVFPPKTATPVLQAPAVVGIDSPGRRASVAAHPGSTYDWGVNGGSITAGWGTNEIVFTMYSWWGTGSISVSETAPGECSSDHASASVQVVPAGGATLFYPVSPCRLLDTRVATGPTGGEPLGSNAIGTFDAAGLCGIPAGARTISTNVTVTEGTGSGTLVVYPADAAKPLATTTPVAPGKTRAVSTHLKLPASGPGQIAVANDSTGTVHVVVDVSGYYQ